MGYNKIKYKKTKKNVFDRPVRGAPDWVSPTSMYSGSQAHWETGNAYYCLKCKHYHLKKSKIGIEHKQYARK